MYLRITALLLLSALLACRPADSKRARAHDYLSFARATEEWLDSVKIDTDMGLAWPDAIDEPEQVSLSYSDGMAGKVIYYLDLFSATDEKTYLDKAIASGDYLMAKLPQMSDSLKGRFWAFSPYGDICGPGFALTELYKQTGVEKYSQGAIAVVDVLEHFADNRQDTLSWDLGNDVLGGLSGTGLFLLYASRELGSDKAREMAVHAGETIIARAIKEADRWSWKRGQNSQYILPNFSHGPAGIGYFLASLYEATGEESFMEAALHAVSYLDAIAMTEEDVYLIPYGFPDPGWSRAYDIGWAHGPAGVARLFIKLHQLTGESEWLEKAEDCFRGIIKSNPLGTPHPDFGAEPFTIDQRFGLAGVAGFCQEMYRYTGEGQYLDQADAIIGYILTKASKQSGLSWPIERLGFMANAGAQTTFTGFFYGSTGFGTILLDQYRVLSNMPPGIRFVDNPF